MKQKLNLLFLDDMPSRYKTFKDSSWGDHIITWAKTAPEAIVYLENNTFDIVFLDHDLTDESYREFQDGADTGQEVARFIANMEVPPKAVILHTFNQYGARCMEDILWKKTPTTQLLFGTELMLDSEKVITAISKARNEDIIIIKTYYNE